MITRTTTTIDGVIAAWSRIVRASNEVDPRAKIAAMRYILAESGEDAKAVCEAIEAQADDELLERFQALIDSFEATP